jgi:PAS domain S-box-containing protein
MGSSMSQQPSPVDAVIAALRRRLAVLFPDRARENIALKLFLLLLVGSLVSGGVVALSYGALNDGLTDQVHSQIESDTSLQATVYENWLAERWTTLADLSRDAELQHDSTSVLHQWLVAEQTGLSESVRSLHVVDVDSGRILGSTESGLVGVKLYDRGFDRERADRLLSISQRPITLRHGGSPMTLLGALTGDRVLVAAVPPDTQLVDSTAHPGAESGLYSLSGHRLLGNVNATHLDLSTAATGTEVTRAGTVVYGTRILAHDVLDATPVGSYDPATTVGTRVVTATPAAEAFAFRRQILNTFVAAFGLTFVLLIGTALVSTRSVTGAIDRLSAKTRRISEGEYDVDMATDRRDELGTLYRSIGAMRDTLERRIEAQRRRKEEMNEAREAAERAKQELRQVIDLVPDRIFARSATGEYLLANEATAREYDLDPDELEGKHLETVQGDVEQARQFLAEDRSVIESSDPLEIPEDEVRTHSGEVRNHHTTKIPFDPPRSDDPAVLGYARDITERKAYERELETQRNNLEVLNKIVRHDIRNNLQLVVAYAETLEAHVEPAGQEYLAQVQESAQQAVAITEAARDVAEAFLRTEAPLETVDLHRVLSAEIENARGRHDQAVIEGPATMPELQVQADELLESVFRNLLQNAVVHNDAPVPRVRIAVAETRTHALVRIADNGPGIPASREEELFEEGVTGLDSEGTGLGLYLVQTLLDQYGGEIHVGEATETLEGFGPADAETCMDGAVFVVALRLADAQE